MQEYVAVGVVIVALLAVIKTMAYCASGIKQKFDAMGGSDPIVSAFAWMDRVTSFRRP